MRQKHNHCQEIKLVSIAKLLSIVTHVDVAYDQWPQKKAKGCKDNRNNHPYVLIIDLFENADIGSLSEFVKES